MPVVALTNIYNPVTFGRRAQEAQIQYNRFIQSGVAVTDPTLAAQIAQGGNAGEVTNFGPLAVAEPNYSSDNPAAFSNPANISNLVCRFRSAARNNSWSTMDIARELTLDDPVAAITGRIGAYWRQDDEQRIIASLQGLLANNIASNAGDMVVNIANDLASAITSAEQISGDAVVNTLQTLGDHKNNVTTLAIHSKVHARLQRQNLITVVRNSEGDIAFETYLGKRLIVDDSLPAVAGTNRITYTSILFGASVFAYAPGQVLNPSEMQRLPSAGNGGGQDVIYSRVHNVWHPYGFDFTSTTVNGGTSPAIASYANLRLAANWARRAQRKNIPLAFLQTND